MKKYIQLIILFVLLLGGVSVKAQIVINTLAELKTHLGDNNGNFVMTPGTYYFNEINCGPGNLFSNPKLLLFTGNNCTFDFTNVRFEVDTKIFNLFGNNDVIEFWAAGNNNTYKNLTLEDIGMVVPSKGAGSIHLDGADNLIEGFNTTVRGSFPYGYGDTFGKGGGSVISHQKHSGILVRGDRNHIKNCNVIMRAYGHGIFVQGSHNAIIEGCYVEGELRTVGEMLEEAGTDSPADNVDFETVWGFNLKDHTSDYTFSLQEAGVRAYSTGIIHDSNGDSTGVSRGTENTTVIDCTIVKMRVGVNTGAESGDNKRIENCTALACEGGFWLGNDGDVINCRADASVGPILSEDISRSNASYEVTILDNYIPKIGDTPYFYAGGTNHNITIHDGTTYYNPDIRIVLGGTRFANRFLTGSVEPPPLRSANNITLTNNTPYPLILESASDCNIFSCGPVEDNGANNTINSLSNCTTIKPCNNTVDNLQAECYDTMFGIGTREINANPNTKEVYGINTGDWIGFNGVDLTGITSIRALVSSVNTDVSIEVRTVSNTGDLLATIPISSTDNETTYKEFSANLNQIISGVTDVYFVFTSATETGWLFNLDKLAFHEDACAVATYNPFLPISAEDFCEASGVSTYSVSDFNASIGDIDNNDYLRFNNVNFGFNDIYNEIEILASSIDGGVIEVRSGSVEGDLLTTVIVENTGSLDNYEIFSSYTSSEITGLHDLYFVFKGAGVSFLRMDNFYFNNDECSGKNYNAYSQIDALSYCDMFGVVPINDQYLGGINDNEWIRYGNVDFTSVAPTKITFNVAGYPTEEEVENGGINVMLDHPTDGELIAQVTVPKTGGWEVWEEVTESLLQNVTGNHEVYLYFRNGAFNLDWFEFHQEIPDLVNLALASNGGIASQSTTAYEGDASRGNDGNTNGNYGSGSVTHTEHGDTGSNTLKWWQVDLGTNSSIKEILIYGRTGSNYINDLNNFTVEVLNENGDIMFNQFYENYPSSRPLTIDVDNKVGRIVKISKTSDRGISLAEVQVFGSKTLDIDNSNIPHLILHPNPANQKVSIINGANLTLEIYNINGVLKVKSFLHEYNNQVSLQNLSSGIYFLKFSGEHGSVVKKLIKL